MLLEPPKPSYSHCSGRGGGRAAPRHLPLAVAAGRLVFVFILFPVRFPPQTPKPPKQTYVNMQLGQLARAAAADPVAALVAHLRCEYGSICLFFYDHNGGSTVALKWK